MCLFKKTPWDLENDINKNEGNGIFTSENVFDYVPSVAWNSFRQDISWRVCYRRGRGGRVYCHIYAVKVMVYKKFSLI